MMQLISEQKYENQSYTLAPKPKIYCINVQFQVVKITWVCWHDGNMRHEYKIVMINKKQNQRTNGPVNAHLISWPSKAQNIQNLENIW